MLHSHWYIKIGNSYGGVKFKEPVKEIVHVSSRSSISCYSFLFLAHKIS